MNNQFERRPTYRLTNSERIFLHLINSSKYKESHHLSKQMIRLKAKFLKKNIDIIDQKLFFVNQIGKKDVEAEEEKLSRRLVGKSFGGKNWGRAKDLKKMVKMRIDYKKGFFGMLQSSDRHFGEVVDRVMRVDKLNKMKQKYYSGKFNPNKNVLSKNSKDGNDSGGEERAEQRSKESMLIKSPKKRDDQGERVILRNGGPNSPSLSDMEEEVQGKDRANRMYSSSRHHSTQNFALSPRVSGLNQNRNKSNHRGAFTHASKFNKSKSALRKRLMKQKNRKKKELDQKMKRLNRKMIYIDNESGQFKQDFEPIAGKNLFNDLNYGDLAVVFINQFYDFMIHEREEYMEKIYIVDKSTQRRKRGSGKLSKRQKDRMRIEEEERILKKETRIEESQKQCLASLGFPKETQSLALDLEAGKVLEDDSFEDDESQDDTMPTTQKNRPGRRSVRRSSSFIITAQTKKKRGMIYGRGRAARPHEMTVKKCYEIYKLSLNSITNIKTLNKDYMMNEEIAFLNALLFHSKENYYRPYEFEGETYYYHEQDKLPFTDRCIPLLEQLFVGRAIQNMFEKNPFSYLAREETGMEDNENDLYYERFRFSFLYDLTPFLINRIDRLVIDRRFFGELMRKVICVKYTQMGLFNRVFYSEDLSKIFMVIKAQGNVLRQYASIELGYTDLFSLEPVDIQLRPFSHKKKVFKEFMDAKERQRKYIGEVVDILNDAHKFEGREDSYDDDFKFHAQKKADGTAVVTNIIPKSRAMSQIQLSIFEVRKLNNPLFLKHLMYQDRTIGRIFHKVHNFLKYPSKKATGLVEDKYRKRYHLERYYTYVSLIELWRSNLSSLIKSLMTQSGESLTTLTKENTEVVIKDITTAPVDHEGPIGRTLLKYRGVFWRLIFMKALGDTNEAYIDLNRGFFSRAFGCRKYDKNNRSGMYLKTIWDRLNFSPMSPYVDYDTSERLKHQWRFYQINELDHRDIFRTMDRIKLVVGMVTDSVNIYQLINLGGFVDGIMPLHDNYELFKESKKPYFEAFPEVEKSLHTPHYLKKLNAFLNWMSDEAEDRDFIKDSIARQLKFTIRRPVESVKIGTIQNYFGEKIALYFYFIKTFATSCVNLGIIGIISYLLEFFLLYLMNSEIHKDRSKIDFMSFPLLRYYHLVKIFNTLLIVFWTTLFLEKWKSKEILFSIEFGMVNLLQKEAERPSFKGIFQRDIGSSELNTRYYPNSKRNMYKVLGFSISFFMVVLSVTVNLIILALRQWMANEFGANSMLVSTIPPAVTFISAKTFSLIYAQLSVYLNELENHRIRSDFENSLITKIFIFDFFNQFNSLILLAFVKERTSIFGECLKKDETLFDVYSITGEQLWCHQELVSFVQSFFIVGFFMNFVEVIVPEVMKFAFPKNLKLRRQYNWGMVDMRIEREYNEKAAYLVTPEVDGVLREYLKAVVLFSFLAFFGQLFSLAFMVAYFTLASEIHLDIFKFIFQLRRPVPLGANSIGAWKSIIEIIAFVSIVTNVGLLTFSSKSMDVLEHYIRGLEEFRDPKHRNRIRFFYFTVSTLLLVFSRKIMLLFFPKVSKELEEVLKRQESIMESFKSKGRGEQPRLRSGLQVSKWREDFYQYLVNPGKLLNVNEYGKKMHRSSANRRKRKRY